LCHRRSSPYLRQVQAAAPELEGGLSRIADRVTEVFNQLREISHMIHPAFLSEWGLTPALNAPVRRSAVPVELDLRTRRRLPGHRVGGGQHASRSVRVLPEPAGGVCTPAE
jgi:signal transduction histidine kinase